MLLVPETPDGGEICERPAVRILVVIIIADAEFTPAPIDDEHVQERLERRSIVGRARTVELLIGKLSASVQDAFIHSDVIANELGQELHHGHRRAVDTSAATTSIPASWLAS